MKSKPDIVDDFFGMCMRYIKYCPNIYYEMPHWPDIVKLAILGIGIDHAPAAKALYMFIDTQILSIRA